MKPCPKISFVIIGHNEGAHLAEAIQAVLRSQHPADKKEIIYVDNNSTDDSLAIARRFPVQVIALTQQSATPGLARNAGLAAATGSFVQFIDGDMILHPQWIAAALPSFATHNVAAVVGRLREQHPESSLYNRWFDFVWKTATVGEAEAPGGGGFFRVSALREVNGYDKTMSAAEETDMGYRLRRRNYKIFRLAAPMAQHDMHMHSFRHFWKRGVRDGYWMMEIVRKYFDGTWPPPQPDLFKMDVQLLAFVALFAAFAKSLHPALAIATLVLPAFFFFKKWWHYQRLSGEKSMSLLAAGFTYLTLLPVAWGQMQWFFRKPKPIQSTSREKNARNLRNRSASHELRNRQRADSENAAAVAPLSLVSDGE